MRIPIIENERQFLLRLLDAWVMVSPNEKQETALAIRRKIEGVDKRIVVES